VLADEHDRVLQTECDPLHDPVEDERAGSDDVGAARVHEPQRASLRPGHRQQPAAHAGDVVDADLRVVDAVGVVLRQVEHHRGHGRDGPGHADQRAGVLQRHPQPVEGGVDVGSGRLDLLDRRRVAGQVPLGHPYRPDVYGLRGTHVTVAVAENELGRAAADVEHEVRRRNVEALEVTGRPVVGQDGLVITGDHLRSHPESFLDAGGEDVAVGRVACRRGRAEPQAVYAEVAQHRGVRVTGVERALQCLVGEPAGGVDALTEPHYQHAAVEVAQPPGAVGFGHQ
jgi:hypothetical protein